MQAHARIDVRKWMVYMQTLKCIMGDKSIEKPINIFALRVFYIALEVLGL